jgi:hypothetical protein
MFWNTSNNVVRPCASFPSAWWAVQSLKALSRQVWRGDISFQQNENERLDTDRVCLFHSHSSGVPVALVGQEGIRCAESFRRRANPELPPQLSAVSCFLKCHWALRCKVWEGGERRRPASQETCLNEVILPACGARVRGGFPLR